MQMNTEASIETIEFNEVGPHGALRVIPFDRGRPAGYEARLAETVTMIEREAEALLRAAIALQKEGELSGEPLEESDEPASEELFSSPDLRVRQLMRIRDKMLIFLWDQEVRGEAHREAL